MINPIDEIFSRYKRNQMGGDNNKGFESDASEPYFDGDSAFDTIRACPKCQSKNISVDMSSNESICLDCRETSKDQHKVNFFQEVSKMNDEDVEQIETAIKHGTTFNKG